MSNDSRAPLTFCAAAALLLFIPEVLAAQAVTTRTIRCGSNVSVRAECRVDGYLTNVRLVRDHDRGRCDQGTGWGFTTSAIWTNNRCVADFEATIRAQEQAQQGGPVPERPIPAKPGSTRTISCGDVSGTQTQCRTGGYATAVRLLRNRGNARCAQGSNWSFSESFIWTNRGCVGDFEVTYRSTEATSVIVTCGDPVDIPVECRFKGDASDVELIRNRSRVSCREGKNWGHSGTAIWTNRGCVGDFQVIYGSGAGRPGAGTRVITCGSASGDVSCNPFGQVAAVRLVRELSRNRCAEGKSWGYRTDEVWTRGGCRAEFEVQYRGMPQPR